MASEKLNIIKKYYLQIMDTIDSIIYFKLNIGRTRRHIKRKRISEDTIGIYRDHGKKLEDSIDLDEMLEGSSVDLFKSCISPLSHYIIRCKYTPSLRDFQYGGIEDIDKYLLKVVVISTVVSLIYFLNSMDDILTGLINGLLVGTLVMVAGIYYPKVKLKLFQGDVKIQIMVTLLDIISSLNAGVSLQESIRKIGENPEYGVPYFEFRDVIYDIEKGGYSFKEALERGRLRSKIPLMKKLYTQLIIAIDKGGAQLLLKSLYNDILRESMSKIDSSKFQIVNLGNLLFGVGIILPFSGMLLSTIQSNTGFSGIINVVDLVLMKIAPISTIIFAIFIKLKIE